MPHFTERCKAGSVLAARASTRSAMPRCGCGRLRMYAKTGSSPSLAFAGLALPVMAAGSVVAPTCAAVRSLGLRAFDFALVTGLVTGFPAALPLAFLTTTARAIFRPPIGSILWTHGSRAATAAHRNATTNRGAVIHREGHGHAASNRVVQRERPAGGGERTRSRTLLRPSSVRRT